MYSFSHKKYHHVCGFTRNIWCVYIIVPFLCVGNEINSFKNGDGFFKSNSHALIRFFMKFYINVKTNKNYSLTTRLQFPHKREKMQ